MKSQTFVNIRCRHLPNVDKNLCTAWSRANWIRYCLHLIFPWPCRPSQAPWLASEPGFDSHWFCLERAKTGKLRHGKNGLGHREQPTVVGSVGVIVFSHSALGSNSRPRNQTPTGRTKVIPTEFNWLLIKHIMRGASRHSSQTLFSWQTTHSQRAHHLQGVTLPLYIFPLSHRCCKDEHEIIQRLWVSFWVEKTWVYGSFDKAGWHTNPWDPDCLALITESHLWCVNLITDNHIHVQQQQPSHSL